MREMAGKAGTSREKRRVFAQPIKIVIHSAQLPIINVPNAHGTEEQCHNDSTASCFSID
jgi:hypothetical protein